MTLPTCPGGTEPKPGTAALVVLGGGALLLYLTRFAPALVPYASVAGSLVIDTGILCNGDRPELPSWTAADIAGLSNGMSAFKLTQTVQHYAWNEFCQCITDPTPPPVTFVAPVNLPQLDPWPSTPCDVAVGDSGVVDEVIENVIPPYSASALGTHHQLPGGVNRTMRIITRTDQNASGTDTFQRILVTHFQTADLQDAGLRQTVWTPPQLGTTDTFAVPATAASYTMSFEWGSVSLTPIGSAHSVTAEVYCDGQTPIGIQERCCPPDPSLIARLDRMALDLALIVSRLGPAADLEVLSTSPISGEGTQALQLGARQILIRVLVAGPGVETVPYANPDRLMRLGTVRFGNDFGWRRRDHVDNATNLFAVPLDSQVVSWSLSLGTSAELVQLGQQL